MNGQTWLNAFSPNNGGIDKLALQVIITGVKIDFNLYCNIPFGDYVQFYRERENYMTERTFGSIYLGPKYNIQGR